VTKTHAEESLGANPGDAALNPADSVAMGVPASAAKGPPSGFGAGAFRALRHPAFRLLFIAFLVNQTGFWVSHISLQGLMVDLTGNDTRLNGLLFFTLFFPAFVFAPLAGVAADRFDRKRIVILCYLSVAICSGVLAQATADGRMNPQLLLVITAAMGLSFAFSGPASSAIAANSVPEVDLGSAVSLQSAANNLTRVAGPVLAAPFVSNGHYEISFFVYLIAAVVSAGLTAAMRITPFEPEGDDSGIWQRIRSGLDHAMERHPAAPALSTVAMLSFFGVSHTVLIPAFAENVLGDKKYFAWLVVATGVGAMVGALRAGREGRSPSLQKAATGLALYGLALAVFATTKGVVVALASQAVVGYFYFSIMTTLQTLIQQLVDEGKRGRVMSLFQVAWAGLIPFGSLSMGYLAGPLGTPGILLATSGVCSAYGVFMMIRSRGWGEAGVDAKAG